jgi:hypothetical protein
MMAAFSAFRRPPSQFSSPSDEGGRPTSMTLPNRIVATYSYDSGAHLAGIDYSFNGVSIGNITYTYDSLNRRIGIGGTLGATRLPQQMNAATYDAANQIATWSGATFGYD